MKTSVIVCSLLIVLGSVSAQSCLTYVGHLRESQPFPPSKSPFCSTSDLAGDIEMDNQLDQYCAERFPGSRAVFADELLDHFNGASLIADLSAVPEFAIQPKHVGKSFPKGGCETTGARLCGFSSYTWDPRTWPLHGSAIVNTACVVDSCACPASGCASDDDCPGDNYCMNTGDKADDPITVCHGCTEDDPCCDPSQSGGSGDCSVDGGCDEDSDCPSGSYCMTWQAGPHVCHGCDAADPCCLGN